MGAVNDCLDLIGISCTAIGLGKGGQMIASHAKMIPGGPMAAVGVASVYGAFSLFVMRKAWTAGAH